MADPHFHLNSLPPSSLEQSTAGQVKSPDACTFVTKPLFLPVVHQAQAFKVDHAKLLLGVGNSSLLARPDKASGSLNGVFVATSEAQEVVNIDRKYRPTRSDAGSSLPVHKHLRLAASGLVDDPIHN